VFTESESCKETAPLGKSMPLMKSRLALCCSVLLLHASAVPAAQPRSWVDEIHVGVLAHDVHFAGGVEHGPDLNVELVFKSPVTPSRSRSMPLRSLLTPHPALGVDINTAGDTSQLYVEEVWALSTQIPAPFNAIGLGRKRIFFHLGIGGALNNGKRYSADPDRKSLGSNALFHASLEAGLQLTSHTDISLYFDHSSNAGLSRYNESLNDAGVRIGRRF